MFTYCPNDIVMDNLTSVNVRVNWKEPTVTENSGVSLKIRASLQIRSADLNVYSGA